jgi:rfaE bifunctional protein nucleotidyltransferase chain/domain
MAGAIAKVHQATFGQKDHPLAAGELDLVHLRLDVRPFEVAQARDLGDYLVLGLNTDASVRLLDKAPGRPYNSEKTRAQVLAGLACVDAIIFFDEETPYQLIQFLEPDVLVKGNDYRVDQIAGFDLVQKRGGKVVTIPLLEGYSTTALVTKIKSH